MRRDLPIVLAVVACGVLAGVAIAGLPNDVPAAQPIGASASAPSTDDSVASGTVAPETSAPATVASVESEPPLPVTTTAAPTSTEPVTTEPATTVAPTTVAPTTVAPTTVAPTTVAPTTVAPTTTAGGTAGLDERVDVSIVLANGDGRFNLVGRNRDRLLKLGYFIIDQQDVSDRPPATIIYYRSGFEDEAERLAGDLQTPNAQITELPDTPVTANDAAGELVVVLGPDAIR